MDWSTQYKATVNSPQIKTDLMQFLLISQQSIL